ncbi:hypothetical protein DMC47_34165, partial [Nostoc sp. 3335mG]
RAARIRADGAADGPSPDGATWSIAISLPAGASPAPLVLGLAGPAERVRPRIGELRRLMGDFIARAGPFEPARG